MRVQKWSSFGEWRANAAGRAEGAEPASRLECPYCRSPAALVKGVVIYPHLPAHHGSYFHFCAACDAYVGCHPGSTHPLGSMADKRTRLARKNAHAVFDPIWRVRCRAEGVSRNVARSAAYEWLASELNMTRERCHIGMMNVDDCLRVIDLCQRLHKQRRQQAAREARARPMQRAWVHPDLRTPEANA